MNDVADVAPSIRIKSIEVDNFKSLDEFHLDLAHFTCLVGLNGAGKSTVLQFFDFLAQQVRGDLKGWLRDRGWTAEELTCHLKESKLIGFTVLLDSAEGVVTWNGVFDASVLQCTTETIDTPSAKLDVSRGRLHVYTKIPQPVVDAAVQRAISSGESPVEVGVEDHLVQDIAFAYEGSVLSQMKPEKLLPSLIEFRNAVLSIKSLDLLSPEQLKRPGLAQSDSSVGQATVRARNIFWHSANVAMHEKLGPGSRSLFFLPDLTGHGGRRLPLLLEQLGDEGRKKIAELLRKVHSRLATVGTKLLPSGDSLLEIQEVFEGKTLVTEAGHINDGLLRVIALLAELQAGPGLLLFDEIENGVNPELVDFVISQLVSSGPQIMVTTHSPLILNYLTDEVAMSGVIYLYKTPQGFTRSIPFFSIPSIAKKLTVMGPGEAFVDTSLTELDEEIEQMEKK